MRVALVYSPRAVGSQVMELPMSHRLFWPTTALLGLSMVASLALAGSPGGRHPCASLADNTARLACYDDAFGRPAEATSAAPAPAAAAPAAVAPEAKARQDFGLSEHDKRARAEKQGTPTEPDSLSGKVASVGHRPTGELVVTLEDGQVWVEVGPSGGVVVKAGELVTIRRASLGSYMLVTPTHVGTRVRRVK